MRRHKNSRTRNQQNLVYESSRLRMRLVSLIIICSLIAPLLVAEDKPLLDQLPQGALQSAFQILRRDYIRRDDLTYEALNRAALQGLLERLKFGAELVVADKEETAAKPQVYAEFLAPDIAYLRPETFAAGEAVVFEKALAKIVDQKARHLILDLRATKAAGSFEEAARMIECFVPSGEVLFKMKQIGRDDAELFISKREPMWHGNVVVLIDGDSNNAAEALAASLLQRGRALLIGEPTRGAAVRISEVKLDDDCALRYASAEMLLLDGSTFFQKGLMPAVVVRSVMAEKWRAVASSRDASLAAFVTDRVRPRFNEAALVRGANPELDDYVRRSKGQPLPGDEGQVRDQVIQRALDLLKSSDFVSQFKLDWQAKTRLLDPAEPETKIGIPADHE